jgi:hypothetical protein
MNLTELTKLVSPRLGIDCLSVSVVDDFFRHFFILGIKEVSVNKEQMSMIVHFYLANIGNDKNGNQAKVMQEGKIDKFLGVKLNLCE